MPPATRQHPQPSQLGGAPTWRSPRPCAALCSRGPCVSARVKHTSGPIISSAARPWAHPSPAPLLRAAPALHGLRSVGDALHLARLGRPTGQLSVRLPHHLNTLAPATTTVVDQPETALPNSTPTRPGAMPSVSALIYAGSCPPPPSRTPTGRVHLGRCCAALPWSRSALSQSGALFLILSRALKMPLPRDMAGQVTRYGYRSLRGVRQCVPPLESQPQP